MSPLDPLGPSADGTTPLTPDETEQLIPTWIRTRGDLDVAEADAITAVRQEYATRVPDLDTILDHLWLRDLHRRMFGPVWGWAGTYRTTDRNIGVDPRQIATKVVSLVADARLWFEHDDAATAAARFHHQLVLVHPFPNGNGRHSRLAADLCLRAVGHPAFTWGVNREVGLPELRRVYVAALRHADAGDLAPLLDFVTS